MDKQCEKVNGDKKHKVSVGRSLTMRFSNFRSKGKSVDKCNHLTGNVTEVGRPLITSLSMGAVDKALWQGESGTDRGLGSGRLCHRCAAALASGCKLCTESSSDMGRERPCECGKCYRKLKGKSYDGSSCVQCDVDRYPVLSETGNNCRHCIGLMSVSASGSFLSSHRAPSGPPPPRPPHVASGQLHVSRSFDRIYASRQGGSCIGKCMLVLIKTMLC